MATKRNHLYQYYIDCNGMFVDMLDSDRVGDILPKDRIGFQTPSTSDAEGASKTLRKYLDKYQANIAGAGGAGGAGALYYPKRRSRSVSRSKY